MAEQPVNYYKTKQPAQLLSNVTQNRISATQNSKKKIKFVSTSIVAFIRVKFKPYTVKPHLDAVPVSAGKDGQH